ncbi:MAG: hypothetical protein HY960_07235 [Ignavibacteriae bacterium]|nr:hypothetical protein [Ignavibacteriota bacterium]
MEEQVKQWTKDQQRVLMESFRKNKTPFCPTDKAELQLSFRGKPKGKHLQEVHYLCGTCNTSFDFQPTGEDMKWRRMNGPKK